MRVSFGPARPSQRRRRWHGLQHLYLWFFYGLLLPKWVYYDDFVIARRRFIGVHKLPEPGTGTVAAFFAWKLFFVGWAIIITVLALAGRAASLVRNARLKPKSTMQTAIGVKHPYIVQRSMGAMGGSFNTREFFHGKSAAFLRAIKPTFLLLGFVVPLALLAFGILTPALLSMAFILQYVGLMAERWFFFAQANHPQNLYYQTIG